MQKEITASNNKKKVLASKKDKEIKKEAETKEKSKVKLTNNKNVRTETNKDDLTKNIEQEINNLELKKKSEDAERLDISELQNMDLNNLYAIAQELNIMSYNNISKHELIFKIIKAKGEKSGFIFGNGILEILPEGYGFLRTNNYLPSSEDIYVSQTQIRKFSLTVGDSIYGQVRSPKDGERYFSLLRIETVNNKTLESMKKRKHFNDLTPLYPDKKIDLEIKNGSTACRLIDFVAPIGFGQRGIIVSPPKAGKTTILKDLATSISNNHPDVLIKVLLIDERPEEVTDMQRSVKGEVVYSTFDEPPEQHVRISELVLESAKRLVETGENVVILLDSITRLARAYNLVVPPSGRTLSGGVDPSCLHKPKRFFGGARNIENGGSLTILATALVDTGSRMDDVIYEEFKGTGNMELHLDRNMANRRIFPAIDIVSSGTRKEELLLDQSILDKVVMLRKNMDNSNDAAELINFLKKTESNQEFFGLDIFR